MVMRTTKRTKVHRVKPEINKLKKLKYRINDIAKEEGGFSKDLGSDKAWVLGEINNLKEGGWLSAVKMKVANEMWRKYAG